MREFEITFDCGIGTTIIKANTMKEAVEKFNNGDWVEEQSMISNEYELKEIKEVT